MNNPNPKKTGTYYGAPAGKKPVLKIILTVIIVVLTVLFVISLISAIMRVAGAGSYSSYNENYEYSALRDGDYPSLLWDYYYYHLDQEAGEPSEVIAVMQYYDAALQYGICTAGGNDEGARTNLERMSEAGEHMGGLSSHKDIIDEKLGLK